MDVYNILAYATIVVSVTLAPGPLSALLVAKTISGDKTGALAFGSGIASGDIIVIALVCGGIGTWLQSMPLVFTVGKALAIIYITWLAYEILRTKPPRHNTQSSTSGKLTGEWASGTLTCITSPHTLMLYLILVPKIIDLNDITLVPLIILLLVTIASLFASVLLIIFLADYIRVWIGPRTKRSMGDWILATVVAASGLSIVAF